MSPEQFAYWLQGKVELHPEAPTPEQWQSIKEHLALVFDKKTPPVFEKTQTMPAPKQKFIDMLIDLGGGSSDKRSCGEGRLC